MTNKKINIKVLKRIIIIKWLVAAAAAIQYNKETSTSNSHRCNIEKKVL